MAGVLLVLDFNNIPILIASECSPPTTTERTASRTPAQEVPQIDMRPGRSDPLDQGGPKTSQPVGNYMVFYPPPHLAPLHTYQLRVTDLDTHPHPPTPVLK